MNELVQQAQQLNDTLLSAALSAINGNKASLRTVRLAYAWHKANRRLNRRYFKQSEC